MKRFSFGIFISTILIVMIAVYAGDNPKQATTLNIHEDPWRGLNGRRMLNNAIQSGLVWEVKMLLQRGEAFIGDINAKDPNGNTPMDLALQYEKPEIVNLLLRYGAYAPQRILKPLSESGEIWQNLSDYN